MIKRKLTFLLAVFAATLLAMALQKPVFLLWYSRLAADASWGELAGVVLHGLHLDLTVAGYVTALPLLVVLLSLWVRLPERVWRPLLTGYFVVVSLFAAAIFAVDIALYEHWGFRLDATVLIYLADPKEAMASVDWGLGVRQTLFFAVWAAGMIALYGRVVRLFDGERLRSLAALPWSAVVLLLGGCDFLAIRGGTDASVANVSKVYFSSNLFLNHAATNPVFSFLSSLGDRGDFDTQYAFYDEAECAERFDALRGNGPVAGPSERVLRCERPNVVIVILESFARTIMEAEVGGEPVMPNLLRLKEEGIWFENFFANSFRTDRGEVAILSGFPAQTNVSIMKLPGKSRNLPSIARSLGREGYETRFYYGGDLNFTDQASYLYATGWQRLIWQKDLTFERPAADWGYDDEVMCDYFADEVIACSASGKPFLAGLLTLSSHTPFDVPYAKFDDKLFNAMAFSDACVGRMIDRLKASPAWDDLLVVLVADHGYPYPATLMYNEPLRHRIPMLWLGGALDGVRTVGEYASQIDLCATLLGQLGMAHDDFDYSKDIFAPAPPRKFAYYAFEEGFGVVDASGEAIWDGKSDRVLRASDPELVDIGRTMLQTTYRDIARR
ncbi:MAG: sulfatase-like hydrolase/transferase [Alistipes sp.]|nr:sulfatase-like hydrolase/transferase [Alistipes sp.]